MSDSYVDPANWPDPEVQAVGNVFGGNRQSPDDAARALELSQATGAPSTVVYNNLDKFELDTKNRMGAQVVRGNPHLQAYVNSHPLAATISNDDWGAMDEVSQNLTKMTPKPIQDAVTAFKEGFDYQGLKGEFQKLQDYVDNPIWQFMVKYGPIGTAALGLEGSSRLFTGLGQGAAAGAGSAFTQITGSEAWGNRLTRDILAGIQVGMSGQGGLHLHPEFQSIAKKAVEAGKAAEPYLKAGEKPPLGLHQEIDKALIQESKQDLDNFDEVMRSAQSSKTKERNPEIFSSFLRQHSDAKISIQADAVKELYKNKLPEEDDGLLGFVPDLQDQLDAAQWTGGDVHVPLADFVAKADPGVYKELKDYIRVRPGGVTKYEADIIKAHVEAYHGSPHDFDAFSMEKVGTGEGAQSYGHGLYFAEQPSVANEYAQRVTQRQTGRSLFAEQRAGEYLRNFKDPAKAIEEAQKDIEFQKKQYPGTWQDRTEITNRAIKLLQEGYKPPTPTKYKVRIHANKEDFLDWDRPFSEQPENVKAAIEKLNKDKLEGTYKFKEMTGEQLMQLLHEEFGKEGTAKALREAGIPGIKYLDQGSRKDKYSDYEHALKDIEFEKQALAKQSDQNSPSAKMIKDEIARLQTIVDRADKPTHNIVLFDEKLAEITHKNEQPVTNNAVDTIRASTKMEPLFGYRKLWLQRVEEKKVANITTDPNVPEATFHNFKFLDSEGNEQGNLLITESRNRKRLYVDDVEGLDRAAAANTMGPRAMRDVLRQLKHEFPEAETLEGHRVSGARDKAETWQTHGLVKIRLSEASDGDLEKFFAPGPGEVTEIGQGYSARFIPEDSYTAREEEVFNRINDEINKLGMFDVDVHTPAEIMHPEGAATGLYFASQDQLRPMILVALEARDPEGTLRHEAMHDFFNRFLTDKEKETLKRAARTEGWKQKYNIDERYGDFDEEYKLEEAIADAFKNWREKPDLDGGVAHKVFEKIKAFFEAIKRAVRAATGTENWQDLFKEAAEGKVYAREPREGGAEARTGEAKAETKEPELPGITRMEDRKPFDGSFPGWITQEQRARYTKLINERMKQDYEALSKKYEADAAKKQTAEWKSNERSERKAVADDLANRPDLAADRFMSTGELYGEKVAKPKLNPESLTPEQVAGLPKEWLSKDGIHPDDLAGLFGYQSGSGMVDALAGVVGTRSRAGMTAKEFFDRQVEVETEQRMQAKYGEAGEAALREAKERALSETQEDLLHEQTLALATKAGAQFPLRKQDILPQIKEAFGKVPVGQAKSEVFMRDAGRAGRAMEDAFLKQDWAEAFRQSQRQYHAATYAKEAIKLEREMEKFDATARRFRAREVEQLEPEYTNWIHDILMRVGKPVRRSVQDLQEAIAASDHATLEEFVDAKHGDMREIPVAEILFDPGFRKAVDDLSVDEFNAVHDSIRTLVKNGRDERKIIRQGEEADLNAVKAQMIQELRTFKERHYDASGQRWLGPIPPAVAKGVRTFLVSHLQLESIFNRWDRGDPRGVFSRYISRELAGAANYEAALERKYSRMLAGIADKATLKEKIENPIFIDPFTMDEGGDGTPIQMTRKNLRAVMLNLGNKSNLQKLARGYGVEPDAIMQWVHRNAKKEDWVATQGMWDIFKEIKREADLMSRQLSGVAAENIPATPIDTPHGRFEGGYYPVIYHPVWEGKSKKLMGGDALEQENYVRASTPKGYTKQRTGYNAPVYLDLDVAPQRMRQMLHDIAFRSPVIQASKIFYDKDIRAAITKHYGLEYRNLLVPYLKDVANSANFRSDAQAVGVKVSEFIRQNAIATLIGLNPSTVMKHGPTAAMNSMTEVGPVNFLKAVKGLLQTNDETGEKNWTFAMKNSEELQRRHRHYNETLGGAQQQVMGESSIRDTIIKFGSYPVAISDLLSAVPTWMAKYEAEMRGGADHGEAVSLADMAVRRAHGSTVITNRPAIARGGAMSSWFSSLYGFFNHIMNRQYEMMWKAGDTLDLVKEGEYKEAVKRTPQLMAGLWSYVLFPAIVEEMVSPLSNDQHESWGKKAAKAVGYTLGSSWVGIRDIVSAIMYGRDPSAGLFTTVGKAVTDIARDLGHGPKVLDKAHAGNLIKHGFTAFGMLTGLVNAQMGRAAEGIYNYGTGRERPKDMGDWWKLLRKGTMKEPKR